MGGVVDFVQQNLNPVRLFTDVLEKNKGTAEAIGNSLQYVVPAALTMMTGGATGPWGAAGTAGLLNTASGFSDSGDIGSALGKGALAGGAAYAGGKALGLLTDAIGGAAGGGGEGGMMTRQDGSVMDITDFGGGATTGPYDTAPLVSAAEPAATGGIAPELARATASAAQPGAVMNDAQSVAEQLYPNMNVVPTAEMGAAAATGGEGAAMGGATTYPYTLNDVGVGMDDGLLGVNTGATPSYLEKGWDWIQGNPRTALGAGLMGMNVLKSMSAAKAAGDLNKAQQQSYQDYLSAINPPESVKAARSNQLLSNVNTQYSKAARQLENALAARGVRGRGAVAPLGDLAQAKAKSMGDAYNQIYGTYNVPSSPGPVNYSPGAASTVLGDTSSIANYLLPLYLTMSKWS